MERLHRCGDEGLNTARCSRRSRTKRPLAKSHTPRVSGRRIRWRPDVATHGNHTGDSTRKFVQLATLGSQHINKTLRPHRIVCNIQQPLVGHFAGRPPPNPHWTAPEPRAERLRRREPVQSRQIAKICAGPECYKTARPHPSWCPTAHATACMDSTRPPSTLRQIPTSSCALRVVIPSLEDGANCGSKPCP